MSDKALVVDIKRMAIHDGDGIRTTVFLKGCPLKCVWCHNPESIAFRPQLAYYANKCVSCGECVDVCPVGAHTIGEAGHVFDRSACVACGRCAEVCLGSALTLFGREMTVDELMPILLEDRAFYENSGGGVTLSGGECLMQAAFCRELLRRLKAEGINTAVDTCGFVPRETLDAVIPYTDTFLYDVKAIDEEVHKRCTGQSNERILDNLRYLDSRRCRIEVRVPYVPGYNDGEVAAIAAFLAQLKNVVAVRVLPYHNFAGSKYTALNMENTLPPERPSEQMVNAVQSYIDDVLSKKSYGG